MSAQLNLFSEPMPPHLPPGINSMSARTAARTLLTEPCGDCLKPGEVTFLRKLASQWARADGRQRHRLNTIINRLRQGPPAP